MRYDVAARAYRAFHSAMGMQEEEQPPFDALSQEEQEAWVYAAQSVIYYCVSTLESNLQYDGFNTE